MLVGGFHLWTAFVCRRVALVGAFRLRVVVGQGSGSVFTVGGMFRVGVSYARGGLLLGRVGRVIGVGQSVFMGGAQPWAMQVIHGR